MFAKRASQALALLLALPSAAFALGLGDIHLLSPLNAPLDAVIEITDVAPDEVSTLQAHLASREMFSQYGLDYPNYLTSVQLKMAQTPDGRQVIKIKSGDPITDPFVTLLVSVSWSHGQLVREYTMLLDPPVYTPGQPSVAAAPISAPSTGADTRAGTIARADTAAPAAAAAAPAATETATPVAAEATPAPAEAPPPAPAPPPARTATKAAPASSAAASAAPEGPSAAAASPAPQGTDTTRVVQRGDTLSAIARSVTGSNSNDARTRSWMLAIYQANPKAFDQNMNVLRSGSVVRIPDAATAEAIPPAEATAEINRQFAAWRSNAAPASGSGESAAAPAAGASQGSQAGRLKLVTPTETASAGAGTAANSVEVSALKGQVKDLEGQLAEQKRLLDLKNQDLARLQSELAAKQTAKAAPPPAPAPAPTPAPAKPPVAQVAPPPAPAEKPAAEQPAPKEEAPPAAAAPPPPVSKPLPKPVPAAKPATTPPAEGGILDTLMGYWWVLALVALVFAGIAGLRFLRSRRASEFDDSLGRLAVAAVAGAGSAGGALGGGSARGSGGIEAPMMRAMPLNEPEPDVVVEESGTHERPRFAAASPAPAPVARHVTADDTISSETAINLDQGDPLAEADFHMAYGLYDQAADLIRIAIGREPDRRDLKLKLLEVFFVWGNKEQFLQTAHELAQSRGEAAPGEWEKILIMGKQLAPEDPLFSGGGAVGGAAAGGVDLDLEGGQSRVDFDLLGEPVPTEQGVDLDIGSAVGEGSGQTEASTGVTDRNLALQGAATGSTRQMTSKMRQPSADAEGPTVEQPMLDEGDERTVRAPIAPVTRAGSGDQTAELAIDDLGLDLGSVDTQEQPVLGVGSDAPTMIAGFDEKTRKKLEDTAEQAAHAKTSTTGQWQFDQEELESALTQAGPLQDGSQTSRLAALRGDTVDIDVSSSATTGTHPEIRTSGVDLDLGTGTYPGNNGKLDLDVGTATVPDAAFAATQRLASEDLALPDLEPVTMSEVGTKLDLARAYMDMGDPDGARNILEEVMSEGSAAQKQEAQRLMESLPG